MTLLFGDMNVLIIGGGSDIGKACADIAVREGGNVLIAGRNEASLRTARDGLSTIGQVRLARLDITSSSCVTSFVTELQNTKFTVDVLIIAVGETRIEPDGGGTAHHFDALMSVNARGPYLLMNAAWPLMRTGGSVVCVTSAVSGRRGRGMTAYAASKAALEAIVRTFALQVADRGVRVNAVAPGPTQTSGLLRPLHIDDEPQARVQRIVETLPRRRLTSPEEVAETVMFLSSSRAAGISATTVLVDGGWTAA